MKFKKLTPRTYLLITALLLLLYALWDVRTLTIRSYFVEEDDLFRIDSLVLQGKAYPGTDDEITHIEMATTTGFDLKMRDVFNSVTDKQHLLDTLRYHATAFSIYTDKDGIKAYQAGKHNRTIEIFRFIIDNKEYTDIALYNAQERKRVFDHIFFLLLLIFLCLYAIKKLPRNLPDDQSQSN
jgi:hypothetical protein